jgi:hypothetical protein
VASLPNQYAAMPSVHIVWSTWSGLALVHLARRRCIKILGALYPLATAAGFLIQQLLTCRPAYPRPDRPVRTAR